MTSRELKVLTIGLLVQYNKFHDRVRRDLDIQKHKLTILLTCTQRDGRSKAKIERTPSEAFEIIVLHDGRVTDYIPPSILEHATAVGLKYDGESFSTTE